VDRAADFESAGGGSTPPGAIPTDVAMRKRGWIEATGVAGDGSEGRVFPHRSPITSSHVRRGHLDVGGPTGERSRRGARARPNPPPPHLASARAGQVVGDDRRVRRPAEPVGHRRRVHPTSSSTRPSSTTDACSPKGSGVTPAPKIPGWPSPTQRR